MVAAKGMLHGSKLSQNRKRKRVGAVETTDSFICKLILPD
jgi:hypothetical protein